MTIGATGLVLRAAAWRRGRLALRRKQALTDQRARCCGFLATPANIARFALTTAIDEFRPQVEHDWALAGG